jgi:hypothetical protein
LSSPLSPQQFFGGAKQRHKSRKLATDRQRRSMRMQKRLVCWLYLKSKICFWFEASPFRAMEADPGLKAFF